MSSLLFRLKESITPTLDRLRLQRRFPLFAKYHQEAWGRQDEILPFYNRYISSISGPDSAISFELAVLALAMCNLLQPQRILDLGSGFSSFLFRYFAVRSGTGIQVWSIDDSEQWLEKTREFLSAHNLPDDHLQTWESFSKSPPDPFDLILHDLGRINVRQEILPQVIKLVSSRGVLLLDDMQKVPYGMYARQLLKDQHLKSYNLKSYTRDSFHRYAFMATY